METCIVVGTKHGNMAGSTRLEINFNRLLHRCEAMAADNQQKSWRLEKVAICVSLHVLCLLWHIRKTAVCDTMFFHVIEID